MVVLAGGERFAHLPYLKAGNDILGKLFGFKRMPESPSTISRTFAKITGWARIEKLALALWGYVLTWIPFGKIGTDWLDLDSSVVTRYGRQQGALRGYNPKKKGRPSHHPLLAFLSDSRFIINLWNRSGNCKSANNVVGFFNETYDRIRDKITLKGIRADSGFYVESFLIELETLQLRYIIPAVFYRNLQCVVWAIESWSRVDNGFEVASFEFKPDKWSKTRRYIAVRREIKILGPNAVGKQLALFDPQKEYTYSCFVTNDDLASPEQIWRDYRPRAGDENIIKEYKEDFALGGFCQHNFYATEAGMLIRALALNLMNLFKREILDQQETPVQRLKTIRLKYFIIPAYMGTGQGYQILRLSIPSQKLRSKMASLLNRVSSYFSVFGTNCNAVGPPVKQNA